MRKKPEEESQNQTYWHVRGVVRWDDTNEPVAGAAVNLYARDAGVRTPIGTAKTDEKGGYIIRFTDGEEVERHRPSGEFYMTVLDRAGHVLVSTHETPVRMRGGQAWEVNLLVPGEGRQLSSRKKQRPQIHVGSLLLDAELVEKAKPEIVLDVARALAGQRVPRNVLKHIEALSPDLVPERLARRTLCVTAIHESIEALIKLKGWPREIALEVDRILKMRDLGFAEETYECPNFIITYQTSGPAAVDPDTSAQDVIDPGSSPPVALTTLPAGSPPTYIKRLCFWLERALSAYTSPPFSMLNPAAGGKIPVDVINETFGGATPAGFHIGNALPADLMCAVAVHELMHMVQYQYGGTGVWRQSVFEGGAVFAEDSAADLMNRYLDEGGTNFNGTGVQVNTNLSIATGSYKCSLFWRYVAEQQSPLITPADEPKIGVETYRRIIEVCSAGSYSTDDVKSAIRQLPWYQDFYEFGYLDPAKLDRTSSETTFGNYALACYLKDLGTNAPDRRFDFMEDEQNIFIDDVIAAIQGTPLQTSLASVTLAGTGTVTTSTSVSFSGSVNSFAHRFHEVTVDPAVTNIDVQFTASGGLTSSIFQIALIDEDDAVRDIHRTDLASYSKRLTSLRDGKKLSKIALVVSGANTGGSFSVSASSAAPAPDVMVTRWHSVAKTEYEIDSRNWAWTWVSPDIWVDNDADGMADDEVFFNFNNKLNIRLHNKGNADASGIQVELSYQDASGGLSSASWLPVQNTGGVTQVLTGLSLAAGASNNFVVDWSPSPSGSSSHFCVRAIVTVPGDPNTDNKRVLSNFGNVVVKPGGFIDIAMIRRAIDRTPQKIILRAVPRLTPDLEISLRDLTERQALLLKPGETALDLIRVTHRKLKAHVVHEHEPENHSPYANLTVKRIEQTPDPRGHYRTDPRALPPGVADRPMLTIVHEVNGLPQGGATFLITLDKGKKKGRPQPRKAKAVKRR